MPDSLYVLAASYENVDDAPAAYQEIDVAWHDVSSSYAFDATVLARDADGKVDDRGEAGLVVVYPPDMADRVTSSLGRATAKVHAAAGVSGEALVAKVRAAEEKAAARSAAGA